MLEVCLAYSKQCVSCYDVRALSACLCVYVSVCLNMLTLTDLPNHMQAGTLESVLSVYLSVGADSVSALHLQLSVFRGR